HLTVPGGTNYTENEISTPLITPSIEGHAQFSTDNGIGWFRSDEQKEAKQSKYYLQYGSQIPTSSNIQYFNTREEAQKKADEYNEDDEFGIFEVGEEKIFGGSKTRRILEIQSDLFQKGRDKEVLIKDKKAQEKRNKAISNGALGFIDITGGEKTDTENQFLQLLNKDNNW